ncbi:MAG: hypothetical protein EZS26_001495 [Candidatus Ordinivivax streblomastigis]|uniref:Fibrobacter succinogenes major paralogous domain-containing protein n=1 Tax=Candidatus Ordinivivax streblomastigis TaxID=2540710 RepID=A0A5M8P1Y6_9BACT|nr:MAG: hypothetical protein EZS26_001495 [Candidatus Ordinivivax streblomastigis]
MRKKVFILMFSVLALTGTSVYSQVRIGGLDDPHAAAILDLNANDNDAASGAAGTNTLGLALPRVALQSTDRYQPLTAHLKGMLVYNTATAGSDAAQVMPGVYYNDGAKWIRMVSGAFVLTDGMITSAHIADGTIAAIDLANNAVTTAKIANDAVTTDKIAYSAVTYDKIAAGAVTYDKIEAGAIATTSLADDAVTTAKILDGTIVTADLADNAVTTAKILDGTIVTADLADNAVTTAKILDGTIVTADLADNAVTTAKILDGTIVNADISSSAAIDSTKIKEKTIGRTRLADNAVTSEKIVDGSIRGTDLDAMNAKTGYVLTYNPGNVMGWAAKSPKATACISCGVVTDYDGNVYLTNTFTPLSGESAGEWMIENLKTTFYSQSLNTTPVCNPKGVVGERSFHFPNGVMQNAEPLGLLYSWDAATNGVAAERITSSANSTVDRGPIGICPYGWHIPTVKEWQALVAVIDASHSSYSNPTAANAALAMLSAFPVATYSSNSLYNGDTRWIPYEVSGTSRRDGGFNVLLAGYMASEGYIREFGSAAGFWLASEYGNDTTEAYRASFSRGGGGGTGRVIKREKASVRGCISNCR